MLADLLGPLGTFYFVMAIIGGVVWLITKLNASLKTEEYKGEAKQKLEEGDWKGAAESYKKAILEQLDNENNLSDLIDKLKQLYERNNVEADLDRLKICPKLIKDIYKNKMGLPEQTRLHNELFGETQRYLNTLP